ncbi:ring finger protein, partial [Reticulomyxa filosa]
MISNENDMKDEKREFLKKAKFTLLCWKEEMSKLQQLWTWMTVNIYGSMIKIPSNEDILEEKKKRIEVLCRAVGVPKEKKDAITKELCDGQFKHYVLTYDNILKMVNIILNVRSNLPTVLMGETGCGKTALIKCLACATNTELEA